MKNAIRHPWKVNSTEKLLQIEPNNIPSMGFCRRGTYFLILFKFKGFSRIFNAL